MTEVTLDIEVARMRRYYDDLPVLICHPGEHEAARLASEQYGLDVERDPRVPLERWYLFDKRELRRLGGPAE